MAAAAQVDFIVCFELHILKSVVMIKKEFDGF